MKRSFAILMTLGIFLGLSAQTWAAELSLRNEEQNHTARVALAYKQGDTVVVKGWHVFVPNHQATIFLPNVEVNEIFIRVEFDNPDIEQFYDNTRPMDFIVSDYDFQYEMQSAGQVMGFTPVIESLEAHSVTFRHLVPLDKPEGDKLHFNLGANAG